jgi:hypothetical protein
MKQLCFAHSGKLERMKQLCFDLSGKLESMNPPDFIHAPENTIEKQKVILQNGLAYRNSICVLLVFFCLSFCLKNFLWNIGTYSKNFTYICRPKNRNDNP